jgi:hypothetical protein
MEADFREEVELDVGSVLKEYRRQDRELSEKARDIIAIQNLDFSHVHKVKARLARERGFGLGEDAIEWITSQILEILLQSTNVEEVYGEDNDLRRIIAPLLKRELGVADQMEEEVRKRIKNLTEGTLEYDNEYQRALQKVRDAKKLQS